VKADHPWQVVELLDAAGQVLDALGPGPCWVSGTLTSWRTSRAFGWGELIEHSADGRRQLARLPIAVPWRVARDARHTLAAAGMRLGDGIDVTVHGCIEVHHHYGPLRFLVDGIAPTASPGAAREAKRALIDRLDAEGLLRLNGTRFLTDRISRVGLVVPATGGAGRADFVGRLVAAGGPFQVVEQRAATQGTDAPAEIARAVNRLAAEHVDVIVVARGGGATGDLAAFDSEPVALAIATAPVPVVVAVGHSTDHTVADEVAHTTLATPTAAAEWLLQLSRHASVAPTTEPVEDWSLLASSELTARLAAEERLRTSRRQTVAVALVALLGALLLVMTL
jgi:exodeoxyribonuclease VII large subunit